MCAWQPCVRVDCQQKLPQQPQVQTLERSTGAISTLDEPKMSNQGKFGCQKSSLYLTNFYGDNGLVPKFHGIGCQCWMILTHPLSTVYLVKKSKWNPLQNVWNRLTRVEEIRSGKLVWICETGNEVAKTIYKWPDSFFFFLSGNHTPCNRGLTLTLWIPGHQLVLKPHSNVTHIILCIQS